MSSFFDQYFFAILGNFLTVFRRAGSDVQCGFSRVSVSRLIGRSIWLLRLGVAYKRVVKCLMDLDWSYSRDPQYPCTLRVSPPSTSAFLDLFRKSAGHMQMVACSIAVTTLTEAFASLTLRLA